MNNVTPCATEDDCCRYWELLVLIDIELGGFPGDSAATERRGVRRRMAGGAG